jgi:hypothetical protein
VRLFVTALLLTTLVGCQSNGGSEETASSSVPVQAAPTTTDYHSGTVVETMDAGGYTYVQVDTGSEKIWAAGPQQEMAVGAEVKISKAMPMADFYSETLERKFDTLYFVNEFGGHEHPAMSNPHGGSMGAGEMPGTAKAAPGEIDFSDIEAADQTVAMIYEQKNEFAGQPVRVRGKVVKALSGIMGTNWLHIQDGTGDGPGNDLTVTSATTAPVGAVVLVEGVLSVDRDFGSGYRYEVIVEDATVSVE